MPASKELKEAAKKEVLAGLRNGTIKVEITFKCQWCRKVFKSEKEYNNHLVDGKYYKGICPN